MTKDSSFFTSANFLLLNALFNSRWEARYETTEWYKTRETTFTYLPKDRFLNMCVRWDAQPCHWVSHEKKVNMALQPFIMLMWYLPSIYRYVQRIDVTINTSWRLEPNKNNNGDNLLLSAMLRVNAVCWMSSIFIDVHYMYKNKCYP